MTKLGITLALLSVASLLGATSDSISDATALALVISSPLFMCAAMAALGDLQIWSLTTKKPTFRDNLRIMRSWK